MVRFGVWEGEEYKGVVIISRGAANHIGGPFGLQQTEIVELTRIALRDHSATVSRIVAVALRLLRKQSPGLRMVISFADPSYGHHGGVYQGGGWLYLGVTPPAPMFLAPDGKLWHSRMCSKDGWNRVYGQKRRVWRYDQCERIVFPGKHKYAMPLDAAMREKLLEMSLPYPKRQKDSSEPPGHRLGEGGAAPTLTLQHYRIARAKRLG